MIHKSDIYIVIPSFQEGTRLTTTIKSIRKILPEMPIVVIDDGSANPETPSPESGITLLRHRINLGKGASLTTGVEYAFKQGAKAVIMMDADGQHDPKHLPEFIRQLKQGNDIVFGTRSRTLDVPLVRFLGNKFAAILIRRLFGVYVVDILSGFRGITKKAYKSIHWHSSRYGVETEMVARLGKSGKHLKWVEIPIDTIYIDKYKGLTLVDGFKILLNSISWKLS